MKNIYFTSDTHYGHKNIVRGTSEWKTEEVGSGGTGIQSVRDFDTMEEHNETLVRSINSMVKEDDILYHLGDWSFGGHVNIKIFREQIHCKNINLFFGNHDQHIEPVNSIYRELFSSVQYVGWLSLKIDSMKSGKYGKTNIFMSHYSHQVWDKSHHGTIHLFGHSHGSLEGIGKSMDVGVDTNNLYPYHLDEILERMKNINVKMVDHHNEKTN
jgi:calcineurin-like phosphoesterase family protein